MWIVLRGPFGSEGVSAFVDTGFDGTVSFPSKLAQRLGFPRRGVIASRLADGRFILEPSFQIGVEWVNGTVQCTGIGGDLDDTLIGTQLLRGSVLTVDFGTAQTVEIR